MLAIQLPSSSPEAIRRAIDECIEEDVLKEFFLTRRNEVEKVTQLDFTFETRKKYIRRDAREEGYEEGREEGRKEEQVNTERERKRAEAAETRADEEQRRADEAEAEVERLKKLLSKIEE